MAPSRRGQDAARPTTSRRCRPWRSTTAPRPARRGRTCPKDVQHAVLFGTGKIAIHFVYDDGLRTYKTQQAVRGRDRQSGAPLARRPRAPGCARRSSRYMSLKPCVACNGYRLKPEALAVKIDGLHIGAVSRDVDPTPRRAGSSELTASAHRAAERDRRAHLQGDPRAARLPQRCRPRLSDPGAQFRLAVGRREPAYPPRVPDRLGPDRRALRAGRALDRPPSARQ